jgi:hypothetical protein
VLIRCVGFVVFAREIVIQSSKMFGPMSVAEEETSASHWEIIHEPDEWMEVQSRQTRQPVMTLSFDAPLG